MEEIEEEINKIENELSQKKESNKKGQSKERMMELHKIRSEKARLKREEKEELKKKEEEIKRIHKEKLELEYQEAQKLKNKLEIKKKTLNKKIEVEAEAESEAEIVETKPNLIKTASRDILKEKFLEEAKKRVMMDLFS